jgi:tetratricopeptide (TPR) repeat protein
MNGDDEISNLAYLPSGELNAPYILASARVLLREKEYSLAISLFGLLKDHQKFGHCAHYGIGQCFFAANDLDRAVKAFEKALSLARKPYIAIALLESLMANKQYSLVEKTALVLASEFAQDTSFIETVRQIYQDSIDHKDAGAVLSGLVRQSGPESL